MDEGLLPEYYVNCFPGQEICDWLSYGNSPETIDPNLDKEFLFKREFSFALPGDIYCRHKSFRSWAEMRAELKDVKPEKIDAGAVWTYSPSSKNSRGGRYEPVEREFVFDIDMNDYDPVRTCCTGAVLCPRCWAYMVVAVKSLRFILTESFGYKHLLWVFSGRRGIHCWVCDPAARRLSNTKRNDLVRYINSGPKKSFPFEDVHDLYLRPSFEAICVEAQNLFVNPEQVEKLKKVLKTPAAVPTAFSDSTACWKAVHSLIGSEEDRVPPKEKLMKITYEFMFPKLDANVSTRMDHLLKLPFSIHPKTGKVCVPFDPEEVERFDPSQVPTLEQITTDVSVLRPYVDRLVRFSQAVTEETKLERSLRIKQKQDMQSKTLTF